MSVIDEIKFDLFRYYGKKSIGFIEKSRLYGFDYMKVWRWANYYRNKNRLLYIWWGFCLYRKSLKYGFQISPQAKIGHGLYIGHFGTVVVGNEVEIGNNCNLSPNVVIGRTNRGKRLGSPHIGNQVWIGSGAVVVGDITIGDNVLIAPNTYVNIDIPSNSIVLGNPARISFNENAVAGYINNMVNECL